MAIEFKKLILLVLGQTLIHTLAFRVHAIEVFKYIFSCLWHLPEDLAKHPIIDKSSVLVILWEVELVALKSVAERLVCERLVHFVGVVEPILLINNDVSFIRMAVEVVNRKVVFNEVKV